MLIDPSLVHKLRFINKKAVLVVPADGVNKEPTMEVPIGELVHQAAAQLEALGSFVTQVNLLKELNITVYNIDLEESEEKVEMTATPSSQGQWIKREEVEQVLHRLHHYNEIAKSMAQKATALARMVPTADGFYTFPDGDTVACLGGYKALPLAPEPEHIKKIDEILDDKVDFNTEDIYRAVVGSYEHTMDALVMRGLH